MTLYYLLYYGKPQSAASFFLSCTIFSPIKALKDMRDILLWDSDSGVRNLEHCFIPIFLKFYDDFSFGQGVIYRVLHNIGNSVFYKVGYAVDKNAVIHISVYFYFFGKSGRAEAFYGMFYKARQAYFFKAFL